MSSRGQLDFMAITPSGILDSGIAIAAARAGAIGMLDLQFANFDGEDNTAAIATQLDRMTAEPGRHGIVIDTESVEPLLQRLDDHLTGLWCVSVAGTGPIGLRSQVSRLEQAGLRVFVVVTDVDTALAAEDAGAEAVIAKGHESGGWVGEEGSFVLLQRCLDRLSIPVWSQGGIGVHTAAAVATAGGCGVVLDNQLLLLRESPLSADLRHRVSVLDGSETTSTGEAVDARFRYLARVGDPAAKAIVEAESQLIESPVPIKDKQQQWRAEIRARINSRKGVTTLFALGQDACFAAALADRYVTVAGVIDALKESVLASSEIGGAPNPIAPGGVMATALGLKYGIVQGPMTRVSDVPAFAAEVAAGGALPFMALALLSGEQVARLLHETAELLGDRPWGVGVLGFVPAELRAEQLEAVRACRPPYALIAGGRASQALALEADGIPTFLHVPSPHLLRLYLKEGATRFVFEGRECGGHVGPRTSFILWESMIDAITENLPAGADPADYQVLFAGGIHDARSAAMVVAAASPLSRLGVRVGVLLGTAYLFTDEAVSTGAITPAFQRAALDSSTTVLLESGPGHATRCLPSPFVDEFMEAGRAMRRENVPAGDRRLRLEDLNLGRLRIAAKGLERARNPDSQIDPQTKPELVTIDSDEQWSRGMFMIGQVASLRSSRCTIAELHDDVGNGSTAVLNSLAQPAKATRSPAKANGQDVAIIGMSCIFPGAPNLAAFWSNIVGKVDAVGEIPSHRWDWRTYFDADRTTPDKIYSRWGGFIDDVEFDPLEFGLPPNSLPSIEPFQLLGLLTARASLADAGYETRPFARDRTSVILGAGGGGADLAMGYTVRAALPALIGDRAPELLRSVNDRLPTWTEDSFPGLLMNVAAGRIANRLDLGGTNFTVDAACGSGLAAVSLAVRELQTRSSDLVITGAVDAIQNPFAFLCFSKTHALSPSGRCRPFDASADGIAISEGFASLVLKRLDDAERDGDRIYAVIKGVGSASDGRDRSLTAPRPEGQMRALRRAYDDAAFSPCTVGLVEAHGTGTVAGDSAEVESLTAVFSEADSKTQACAIGSVKSMIGHTKATAGIAGLIKAALALHHRVLPPTLGVDNPNPKAGFSHSPFYVNSETRPWIHGPRDHGRRAGVSAFGFGGTNFHTVLEEYRGEFLGIGPTIQPWPAELLVWRGERADIAADLVRLAAALESATSVSLADLAFTLASTRSATGAASLGITTTSIDELRQQLPRAAKIVESDATRHHGTDGIHFSRRPMKNEGQLAFLFPGQGSQQVGMADELANLFPEVRSVLDHADYVLADQLPQPLSRFIFPPPAFNKEDRRLHRDALTQTNVAQPALGAIELATFRLLESFDVHPDMTAGHSYGEFVALAAAGSLTGDDMLRLSEARGRFIDATTDEYSGTMAAIDAGRSVVERLLRKHDVVVANINAPDQVVISGSQAAITGAISACSEQGLTGRKLSVACAFHSRFVAPARHQLADELRLVDWATPHIPVFSNTTGGQYPGQPEQIVDLLSRHLVEPVEFEREIIAMHELGARLFIEVGPKNVLTGLVGRILGDRDHVALSVDRPGVPGVAQFLRSMAGLWVEGVAVDIDNLFAGRSVDTVDFATLKRKGASPTTSRSTWLVNGGRARPAFPSSPNGSSPPRKEKDFKMSEHSGSNGSSAADNARPTTHDLGSSSSAPLETTAVMPPVASTDTSAVMAQYHEVMARFLESEREVMLTYLGQPQLPSSRPMPNGRTISSSPPHVAALPPPPPPDRPAPPTPQPATESFGSIQTSGEAAPIDLTDSEPAAQSAPGDGPGIDIAARLITLVAERTGYPEELLDLDADMEADLGIDSIKRVEIAGSMLHSLGRDDFTDDDTEELTAARTLRSAIEVLHRFVEPRATAVEVLADPF